MSVGAAVSGRRSRGRLLALVLLLTAIVVVGKVTGFSEQLQTDRIRLWVESMGPAGILLFLALYAVGVILHVPGMVFVAAAIFLYGRVVGGGVALLGGVLAVTASFLLVRGVGGTAFAEIDRPLMKRLLVQLDRQPLGAIILLRMIFWMLPPLNYALALTRVRFRDYLVGSTLGLIPPIAIAALFFDWLFTAG
jgi:uncharacterized membrane protein YdjX (TVP38/TMEM64 family)